MAKPIRMHQIRSIVDVNRQLFVLHKLLRNYEVKI